MKKEGIVIRAARHEDMAAVMRLGAAMHAESRFARYPLSEAKLSVAFADHLDKPAVACLLLAEHTDGRLLGMLAGNVVEFFFSDARLAQDILFFVMPEARGTSAAIRLLTAFRRWAENRQVEELNINMSAAIDMPRFNRFMTHIGFSCCGSNFHFQLKQH